MLPAEVRLFTSSSLLLGTLSALLLNIVFRLGVRRAVTLTVDPGAVDPAKIEQFMETQGAAWGARRDVIDRARFNLAQSIETIFESCSPRGPVEIEASFDEFNLDLRVSYDGPPLELPDRRPSARGNHRLGGGTTPARRLHAATPRGPSAGVFRGRPLDDPVSLRSLEMPLILILVVHK